MTTDILAIGDTHFYNQYPHINYIQKQFDTVMEIIRRAQPRRIVFLGDIFHFRKPDPSTILLVRDFFLKLSLSIPGLRGIYILRGNHDTASKSDEDVITILNVLNGGLVTVIDSPVSLQFYKYSVAFMPHYEGDDFLYNHIKHEIKNLDEEFYHKKSEFKLLFGHHGYRGCFNTNGDEDCKLSPELFKYPTFLGHIHKPMKEGNVCVVGTPYSTAFNESDYDHQYVTITEGVVEYHKIDFGIRHVVLDLESLESHKEYLNDPKYTTILRVYLSQILDQNSVDLRKSILKDYNVGFVDIKFLPLTDKKKDQSNFRPSNTVFELSEELIDQYCSENTGSIPKEKLLAGLELLRRS